MKVNACANNILWSNLKHFPTWISGKDLESSSFQKNVFIKFYDYQSFSLETREEYN